MSEFLKVPGLDSLPFGVSEDRVGNWDEQEVHNFLSLLGYPYYEDQLKGTLITPLISFSHSLRTHP
jgi:hypothetical protein